jgi:hypothetical protein
MQQWGEVGAPAELDFSISLEKQKKFSIPLSMCSDWGFVRIQTYCFKISLFRRFEYKFNITMLNSLCLM